jgi:hypothetical protein
MLKRVDDDVLDLLAFLEGETLAQGVFEDRYGRLKRRFSVEMRGRGSGNDFTLDEHFTYDDGIEEFRTWRLRRGAGGRFSGRCAESVGDARGWCTRGMARMDATLRLPMGNRALRLHFADAFYRIGADRAFSRSIVSKWCIRVGTVLMVYQKG